ncbi:MAG TPA: hypothetical protein VL098_14835 [Flavipsychrobacter sp.]|nr:hypothetical protein [Flavipsychrobacter sp.]
MKNLICTSFVFLATFSVKCYATDLTVHSNIVLPKDSIESKALIMALNGFLSAAEKPNEDNVYVLDTQQPETFILLDEVKGIEVNKKLNEDHFYKPYLTNIIPLKDHQFYIQVSYIGVKDDQPELRASFNFIAHKVKDVFVFSSPLLGNTQHWKVEKTGNNIFHYQTSIDKSKTTAFSKITAAFDSKLKVSNKTVDYYCCENSIELQKLVGVAYKSDYNGRSKAVWSAGAGNRKLIVLGNDNASFSEFDPHDLWHDRLGLSVDRSKVNKPVDEGCAYLYGGSWGLSWEEIFKAFKEQVANDKNINWMQVKETPVYFKTKAFNNSADYIVNALLVQKIEKEKGFSGVWELLNIGPFEKGNERYYATLEKLTGITKSAYNEKVWELINSEK